MISDGDEDRDRIHEFLARLPDIERRAFIMRVEERRSFQEIADAIGAPSVNAVRMMVARVLVRMPKPGGAKG